MRKLLQQVVKRIGGSIPWVGQDWANTKAAYRFFSNPRVSEEQILGGHFQATRDRISARNALILMLHDTTEFTFRRNDTAPVGILHKSYMRKNKKGRPVLYAVCGILMHSSLAVTTEGLPLGLAAIKFWTRDEFKGCNALKKKINSTRVPIERKESYRWLENVRQSAALFERLDSGCSASRTGIATARWRSMWPSRHATSHRCRAMLTSRRAQPS